MAESRTEPAFMKFLCATIETLPHGLSGELLKTATIKNVKSKKFEINLQKGRNLLNWTTELANQVIIQVFSFALFGSDTCFDFSVCHHFTNAQMIRNNTNTELIYYIFVILEPSS